MGVKVASVSSFCIIIIIININFRILPNKRSILVRVPFFAIANFKELNEKSQDFHEMKKKYIEK